MYFKLTPAQIDAIIGIALEVQAEPIIKPLTGEENELVKLKRIHSKVNNALMLPVFRKSDCSSTIKPLVEPFK